MRRDRTDRYDKANSASRRSDLAGTRS
jgi:hypothetical protein